jgi:hypothetical protein
MNGGCCIVRSVSSRQVAAGFLSSSAKIDGLLMRVTGRLSLREECMTVGS